MNDTPSLRTRVTVGDYITPETRRMQQFAHSKNRIHNRTCAPGRADLPPRWIGVKVEKPKEPQDHGRKDTGENTEQV